MMWLWKSLSPRSRRVPVISERPSYKDTFATYEVKIVGHKVPPLVFYKELGEYEAEERSAAQSRVLSLALNRSTRFSRALSRCDLREGVVAFIVK